jgi:hypothetical protein
LTLQATINVPALTDDPTDSLAHLLNGFILLVNLFRPFDDTFVSLWNKTRDDCAPAYLSALQKQLQDALPTYLNDRDSQFAERQTNQQWLKNMTWQLRLAKECLTSNGNDPSISLQYPVSDALNMVAQFSTQNLDGIDLVCSSPFSAFLRSC